MSLDSINCPKCSQNHKVIVFRNGCVPTALLSDSNKCSFSSESYSEIVKLFRN